jgi:predicted SnoaL-like aldol condensation-catalyzing enzyme
VREDYIQHSAMGKGGRQGLFEMIEFLKTLPPSTETKSPVKRLIGDGDMVTIELEIAFMGKRMMVIDLFRIQDGMLAEHWDAVQEITEEQLDDHAINELADTSANKKLVTDFYKEVVEGNQPELIGQYVSSDYLEYSVNARLDNYAALDIKVHRIIGECDTVVVQSEYKEGDNTFALYDVVRIADGKIVVHWSVRQAIPDVIPHNNGMF